MHFKLKKKTKVEESEITVMYVSTFLSPKSQQTIFNNTIHKVTYQLLGRRYYYTERLYLAITETKLY